MGDVLIPIFGIVGVFGSLSYVAYVILEGMRSRQQARLTSEFHHKLLDRVSSAQELGLLLNSEGGAKLLASLATPRSRGTNAHDRILRAAQTGLVLLLWKARATKRLRYRFALDAAASRCCCSGRSGDCATC